MSLTLYSNIDVKIIREVYYDSQKMWGIYGAVPESSDLILERNKYNNVAIQGNVRRLRENDTVRVSLEGAHQGKYGHFYKITDIEPEKLDSIEDQDNFLSSIITERQFSSLKEAYPDSKIVDLILKNKINVELLKGIGEKTLAKIKEKVQKNSHISVLIARLNELELSANAINRLLDYFESSERCVDAIDTNIYSLCKVPTFGFLTIDRVALARGDDPVNRERIIAYIDYYLGQEMQEGHSWSYLSNLVDKATGVLNIDSKYIHDTFNHLKEKTWEYYFNEGAGIISKRQAWQMESDVYKHLKRISDSYRPPNINNMNERIKDVESYQKFQFTDEQREAILDGSQHGVIIVNGLAGSGKTGTVKGLIDSLGVHNYMTCALSGSAVKVLSKRGIHASTIHRMLGYRGEEFSHNEENKLSYDLIVIDEMSMIDIPLLLSVLKSIESGTKLILVGDSGQLPPINFGHPLEDLLDTDKFPSYELTKVHRQAEKSGILALASKVRSGEQPFSYNSSGSEIYGELKDQTVAGYPKSSVGSIPYDVLSIAESYNKTHVKTPEDLIDFQVIVPNRSRGALSVRSMNIELQQVFNDVSKPHLYSGGYEFREGDKVIISGNSYNMPLFSSEDKLREYLDLVEMLGKEEAEESLGATSHVFNGTMGHISSIAGKHALVKFEDVDSLVAFERGEELSKLELGYAATTHRLQGNSIKNTVFCLDFVAYTLLSRQLVYTGLTRASGKCILLAETNALHKAIGNDISGARRTFLKEIILND